MKLKVQDTNLFMTEGNDQSIILILILTFFVVDISLGKAAVIAIAVTCSILLLAVLFYLGLLCYRR